VIFATTAVMWALIVERLWFLQIASANRFGPWVETWRRRTDLRSWRAKAVRSELVSRAAGELRRNLDSIRALMTLLPLLGLLGTVTGMIAVFDVMAAAGTANPRLMASGVFRATLPTMAGLVAALSGVYVITRLERWSRASLQAFRDQLATVHGSEQQSDAQA
jgi:biopolymer transport protein ExbB